MKSPGLNPGAVCSEKGCFCVIWSAAGGRMLCYEARRSEKVKGQPAAALVAEAAAAAAALYTLV